MLFLDESNHKPNKIWLGEGSEFYSRSMKLLLQNNDTEMYSTQYNKYQHGLTSMVYNFF